MHKKLICHPTEQCSSSFVHDLKTTHQKRIVSFFKPCTRLTLHCNHESGHLETEHTESLLLLLYHLRYWSHGPTLSKRSKLLVAHETVDAADSVFCARVRLEINSLITFEIVPFFCVCFGLGIYHERSFLLFVSILRTDLI
jgi:hypothetical protein